MQGVARAPEALPAPASDRTALWLPLLRRFTELSPRWVVWKNADAALAGVGDIDAAAPESDWPALEGALLLSVRGGDFELTVGQDLSIGYAYHEKHKVELFLTESFTFRVLEPTAAVPLRRA